MTEETTKAPDEESFGTIIALPRLNIQEMSERLKTAANAAQKVENARQVLEEAKKNNPNNLIF